MAQVEVLGHQLPDQLTWDTRSVPDVSISTDTGRATPMA